jgi:Sec-independent protein secretion pathway component TatC
MLQYNDYPTNEADSSFSIVLEEIWWRGLSCVSAFILALATCLYFYEELFFFLAFPLVRQRIIEGFLSLHLSESFSVMLSTSSSVASILCSFLLLYQALCFFLPSCKESFRQRLQILAKLQSIFLITMLVLFYEFLLPNIWLFFFHMTDLITKSDFFSINLQPRLSDFVIMSVKVNLFCILFSQTPSLFCILFEWKMLDLSAFLKKRRTGGIASVCMCISAILSPPSLYIQLLICMLLYGSIELSIFMALLCL